MAIRDWLTFPSSFGDWGMRANAWMNELKTSVNSTETSLTSLQAQLGLTSSTTFNPTLTNLTGTTVAEYLTIGGWCLYSAKITMTGAGAAGAIFIQLPVPAATAHRNRFGFGTAVLNDVSAVREYDVQMKIEIGGTTFSVWSADSAGVGSIAWFGSAPVAIASGDTLAFTIIYPTE